MIKRDHKRLLSSAGWLTVPFLLFSLLIYFTINQLETSIGLIVIFLFTPALYLSVLAIVSRRSAEQSKEVYLLAEALTSQKVETNSLKNQLEENTEKRIYELQIANGALNREIGERIQAEEEVRELQKQLSLILDSAGEGILGIDNKGRVTFLNSAATIMLGWEAEEIVGKEHHGLIHHSYHDGTPHPVDQCPIHMAYRDGLVHYKTGDVFWCKNGISFPVEYSSTPINDQGMLTGAVVVFRDMSTFK